ncbi:SPOR domain-containing protein [Gilliamella sp. B2776]|uniref:SPOR domain-containing protein n=1 Tax=unclassified Gilliamella TaxID=2685620 RepID=UPI00226AC168|nr:MULTISPECIES: SPOR domain-containing protein [unclassified Gilliamella]MCX8648798.1 SPOR domain-containing protein [Gilliamella sp. B2779]MCX8653326.1 SPOR domain-containing protein [Gilliamella sp. B2737]MCX8655602.1 SPOR domain-containing protein [Gilliamella sp. B2894]MCX8690610.1 SPOR domain-containing protein [Gilliamella sp. B2776]MCX8694813.1 SPOR domain-containing protein [Gilliamella sp. B2881]
MMKNQKNCSSNQNRIRNQLVGFATLLLILAVIAPWILTDKSNQRTLATPILQPEIVNQQNQFINSSNESSDEFDNINISNMPNTSYISGVDQNSNPLTLHDISENDDESDSKVSEQEPKSFMIQLTALKNKQKIEELVALLRLNNYNVKVIPKNPDQNQLIKLQVGPYAKKEQAEQIITNLDNLTKLKGIIVSN